MLKGGADTVQGHRKQFCIWTGKCIEARSADPSARSAEKNFSSSLFSRPDWLSYHLRALHALLTGRLSLSDVLELAILWALITVTVML